MPGLLPVQREAEEYVIPFQSVLSVELVHPLGDERYALIAHLFRPEQRRSDACYFGLEIAQYCATAAVTSDLIEVETMKADSKRLRQELVESDIHVQILTGLIICGIVLGVVNVANVEGEIAPRLRIQIGERKIGVKAPVVRLGTLSAP